MYCSHILLVLHLRDVKLSERMFWRAIQKAHLTLLFVLTATFHERGKSLFFIKMSESYFLSANIKGLLKMKNNLMVRGVVYEADVIRLTIGYDYYETASLAEIFSILAENKIKVDMIMQSVMDGVKPTVAFTIAKEKFADSLRILEASKASLGFRFADVEVGLAKISIIGAGIITSPGIAALVFARLGKEHIPVKMVSASEVKVSVIVPQVTMMKAANVLNEEFMSVQKEMSILMDGGLE